MGVVLEWEAVGERAELCDYLSGMGSHHSGWKLVSEGPSRPTAWSCRSLSKVQEADGGRPEAAAAPVAQTPWQAGSGSSPNPARPAALPLGLGGLGASFRGLWPWGGHRCPSGSSSLSALAPASSAGSSERPPACALRTCHHHTPLTTDPVTGLVFLRAFIHIRNCPLEWVPHTSPVSPVGCKLQEGEGRLRFTTALPLDPERCQACSRCVPSAAVDSCGYACPAPTFGCWCSEYPFGEPPCSHS